MMKFNPAIHFKPVEPDVTIPANLEDRIYEKCKEAGMDLEKLNKQDSDFGKFDAWWIEEDDERRSLKIKQIDTNDEIVQELQNNLTKGILGTDINSAAQQVLFVNNKGNGYLFENRMLREKLMYMYSQNAVKLLGGRREQVNLEMGVTIRVRKDEYSQGIKCLAIFKPEKWNPISILSFKDK